MSVTSVAPRVSTVSSGAHRVIFIDLGRFLALVFMLYGHTVSALLAAEYQRGTWFDVWQFQRGLTSSLFLLLSGFAFSLATSRHWSAHQRISSNVLRRTRRFGLFILLGYALHFPVVRFSLLRTASDERWQTFLAVDVLQLIGVTFLFVQLLVLVMRSRLAFTIAAFALSVAGVVLTHRVWAVDWNAILPLWMASYLSTTGGSLFPLFPWASYMLFGVGLGQVYVGWGAARLPSYAAYVLLLPGTLLIVGAWALAGLEGMPWSADPWNFMPIQVPIRVGSCLIILSAIALASQHLARLPRFFAAVAQETLPIYFVHLCIVYGSIWNAGLSQAFGGSLGPWPTAGWVVVLLGSMAVLGWSWHWMKHARPRLAAWTAAGTALVLAGRLL